MSAIRESDQFLTVDNYMERDTRLDVWSVYGIGSGTHSTKDWVRMFLDIAIDVNLPEYLQGMFDRAKACIVYGCYHYPLFTLGVEELYRFGESAFREAVKETKPSDRILRSRFAALQKWALKQNLLDDESAKRWDALRKLRNSFSHKDSSHLVGPNDALRVLTTTKELTETLYQRCRADNFSEPQT